MATKVATPTSYTEKGKTLPFFTLRDLHPQHGDKTSIIVEQDTPEGRALIASHLEDYKKQGIRVYVTLTEKKDVPKGFFFIKMVEIEEKVSYLVKGYDAETNEWVFETNSPSKKVPETRRTIRNVEATALRPCYGG